VALVSELPGLRGAYRILQTLEGAPAEGASRSQLMALVEGADAMGVSADILDQLQAASLMRAHGDRLRLTSFGLKTYLLLEAINGGDVNRVFARLGQIDGAVPMYELAPNVFWRQRGCQLAS